MNQCVNGHSLTVLTDWVQSSRLHGISRIGSVRHPQPRGVSRRLELAAGQQGRRLSHGWLSRYEQALGLKLRIQTVNQINQL